MDIRCQCNTIHFSVSVPAPLDLYHCHCTSCRLQSASAFGTSAIFPAEAIFPLSDDLAAKLGVWNRPGGDESQGRETTDCYFCKVCGVRIMHRARMENGREGPTVSVKGGCVQGLEWQGAKHIFCRSAVVPIPEGVERWEGAPDV